MKTTNIENERRELFKQAERLLSAESEQKNAPQAKTASQPLSATALSYADAVIEEGRAEQSERIEIAAQFDRAMQDDLQHPVSRGESSRVQSMRAMYSKRPLTATAKARQNELLSHTALGREILNGENK